MIATGTPGVAFAALATQLRTCHRAPAAARSPDTRVTAAVAAVTRIGSITTTASTATATKPKPERDHVSVRSSRRRKARSPTHVVAIDTKYVSATAKAVWICSQPNLFTVR